MNKKNLRIDKNGTERCRICVKKAVAEFAKNNPNYYKDKYKKWIESGRQKKSSKKWAILNKYKVDAHRKLNNAIKNGIIKKKNCRDCGKPAEAHHPDYRSALKVIWLCRFHHRQEHLKIKNKTND